MELKGIQLAFPNIAPEHTEDYNRWYDLDHLAEHISKPDVLMARRYVAPADLHAAPGVLAGEATAGHQPYATIYFLGVEDFASEEVLAGWKTKDRVIIKAGRFWREGIVPAHGRWRVAHYTKRASLHVADEAVPYLAHRGIIVAIGRSPTPEHLPAAIGWWNETHLPDVLTVPGTLAAIRFEPGEAETAGLMLHLILLEDDPAEVMPRLEKAMRYNRACGRFPAHGGVYEPISFVPYRTIIPLQYDFAW